MECWVSSMTHLDSWDVLGHYDMHVFAVENYFDIPNPDNAKETNK